MCAVSSTGNTPQFICPIRPNWPIIWDIFEKSPFHKSIVHESDSSQADAKFIVVKSRADS